MGWGTIQVGRKLSFFLGHFLLSPRGKSNGQIKPTHKTSKRISFPARANWQHANWCHCGVGAIFLTYPFLCSQLHFEQCGNLNSPQPPDELLLPLGTVMGLDTEARQNQS